MTRCPRCKARAVFRDDDQDRCLMCGEVVADRTTTLTERLVSQEVIERSREAQHGRPIAGPSMEVLKSRVLDRIRAEARS